MRQQQQQWDNDITASVPSSPRLWLGLLWLAVQGGQNPPQALPSPAPPQTASLGAQPISSRRRLRHMERKKQEEEDAGGAGR